MRRRAQIYPRGVLSAFFVLFGKMAWRKLGSFASAISTDVFLAVNPEVRRGSRRLGGS